MLTDFEKKGFNIILQGPNGCGKTTLIKKVVNTSKTKGLYFTLNQVINNERFFDMLHGMIKEIFKTSSSDLPDILNKKMKKFIDLFETLSITGSAVHHYLVIDGIDELQISEMFKKFYLKLFGITNSFPKLKIIFISNLNLAFSETMHNIDFSNYTKIHFPRLDESSILTILELNGIDKSKHFSALKKLEGINTINLNELIHHMKTISIGESQNMSEEMVDYMKNLKLSEKVEEYKRESKLRFIQNSEINTEFIETLAKEKEKIKSPPAFKTNDYIKSQLVVGPFHYSNLVKKEDNFQIRSSLNYGKNLSEGLSHTQKLLLLSAFFATESSAKVDSVTFKSVKRTKNKIYRTNRTGLKTKTSHSFNISRLLAIYSSVKTMQKEDFNNSQLNIELISDITTLIDLGLLRYVKFNEFNFLSRKIMGNVSYDLASKIADDYSIKLSDFIKVEEIY